MYSIKNNKNQFLKELSFALALPKGKALLTAPCQRHAIRNAAAEADFHIPLVTNPSYTPNA